MEFVVEGVGFFFIFEVVVFLGLVGLVVSELFEDLVGICFGVIVFVGGEFCEVVFVDCLMLKLFGNFFFFDLFQCIWYICFVEVFLCYDVSGYLRLVVGDYDFFCEEDY